MDRKEKIKLLNGLTTGKIKFTDLRPKKFEMIIYPWGTAEGLAPDATYYINGKRVYSDIYLKAIQKEKDEGRGHKINCKIGMIDYNDSTKTIRYLGGRGVYAEFPERAYAG
jgi:hypothetical protein